MKQCPILPTLLSRLLCGVASIVVAGSIAGCSDEEPEQGSTSDRSAGAEQSGQLAEPTAVAELPSPPVQEPLSLAPQVVRLSETNHLMKEKEFLLNVPEGYTITPVAEGMQRVRFMAFAPDGRLFATDMRNLSDNDDGIVWVLDDYDSATRRYTSREAYLEGLRNPNSIAFHTDRGRDWLYVALTDRLIRYPWRAGSSSPAGRPETLATFPDSGRSYREGGWHLTRTIAFGEDGRLYVSVGSSCNVCVEKEEYRAVIIRMNPDGTDQAVFATGLRNAVGLRSVAGHGLFATNMGADHLGLDRPEDNFYRIVEGGRYGWPYAFEHEGAVVADPVYGADTSAPALDSVGRSIVGFPAHASPLGFDWFGPTSARPLRNTFLVALHGSGAVSMGRGYRVVRVGGDGRLLGDFVNGFLVGDRRYGRPCDILRVDDDSFLLSDDHAGVIYLVHPAEGVSRGPA